MGSPRTVHTNTSRSSWSTPATRRCDATPRSTGYVAPSWNIASCVVSRQLAKNHVVSARVIHLPRPLVDPVTRLGSATTASRLTGSDRLLTAGSGLCSFPFNKYMYFVLFIYESCWLVDRKWQLLTSLLIKFLTAEKCIFLLLFFFMAVARSYEYVVKVHNSIRKWIVQFYHVFSAMHHYWYSYLAGVFALAA